MHTLPTNAVYAYRQVRQLRLHGMIARELGIAILSGQYKPGDVLMGEEMACRHLQVSRSSYREAIQILVAKGLIHSKTRVGTRVCPPAQWSMLDPDVLAWMFHSDSNPHMFQHLLELRNIIEPPAAAYAALKRSDEDIDAMRASLDTMTRKSLQTEEGRIADQDFHARLLLASKNPFLICLENSMRAAIGVVSNALFDARREASKTILVHKKILDAVANKNAVKAKAAVHDLIRLAQQDIGQLDKCSSPLGAERHTARSMALAGGERLGAKRQP